MSKKQRFKMKSRTSNMDFDNGVEEGDEEGGDDINLEPPPLDEYRINDYTGERKTPIISLIDYQYLKPSIDPGTQKPIRECFKPNFGVSYAE
jgi:hypothetical protein